MEYLVLNSYLEFKKQRKKKWRDVLKESGYIGITCLIVVFLEAGMAILGTLQGKNIFAWICIIVELVSVGIFILYINYYEVRGSRSRLEESEKDYQETLEWLKQIGYGEKIQIKQLCARCEVIIQIAENKKEKAEKDLDKIITVMIFPAVLATMTAIFQIGGTVEDCIAISIVLVCLCVGAYFILLIANRHFNKYMFSDEEEMKQMLSHLHGVLDRCFSLTEEDIV